MPTVAEASAHIFLTPTRFNELVAQGIIAKAERGAYDFTAVREQYIKHIRKKASGRTGEGEGLSEARAELAREQTEGMSIKNAVARGEYVPLTLMLRGVELVFSTFRERALAIPGKIAATLEMRSRGECEDLLRSEISEALDELSKPIVSADDLARSVGGDSGGSGEGSFGGAPAAEPHAD